MKAYKAWDKEDDEGFATIVFAESAAEAKKIAQITDACDNAEFINIRVKRCKEADELYKGKSEIDWYDDETRLALIRDFGWGCYDTSYECENCVAKKHCRWWQENEE